MVQKILYIAILATLLLIEPTGTQASTLSLKTSHTQLALGDEFTVKLNVIAEKPINTVGLTLLYPVDGLVIQQIETNNSIIKLWTHTPANSNSGSITFSGGLPHPGFQGNDGQIATIVFKTVAVGTFNITIEKNASILLNDGKGTADTVTIDPLSITTNRLTKGESPQTVTHETDTIAPENIIIEVGKDPGIFDGKFFAAFNATDTGTGIAKFEIAETQESLFSWNSYPNSWKEAKSPVILDHQNGRVKIFVRAVDHAGNQTINSIEKNLSRNTPIKEIVSTLVLVSIGILVIYKFLIRKK